MKEYCFTALLQAIGKMAQESEQQQKKYPQSHGALRAHRGIVVRDRKQTGNHRSEKALSDSNFAYQLAGR